MKRALIITAIILLIAAVVGIVLLGNFMLNNYAETGSIFGSSPDISGSFWDKLFGKNEPEVPEDWQELVNEENFKFEELSDGTIGVKLIYDDGSDVLVIPEEYNGKPVSEVLYTKARPNAKAKKLIIPDSITKIEYGAFGEFPLLEEIIIGNGLKTIPESAFKNAVSLTSVTIGNSVTKIDDYAFENCTSLKNIVIPDSVAIIGERAFSNCRSLKQVTLGKGVKEISRYAFAGCGELSEINLNEGITRIGERAFLYTNMTRIHIPASVTQLASGFLISSELNSITVDPNNTKYYSTNNCLIEKYTNVLVLGSNTSIIPDDGSVATIGPYAFYNLKITNITIPQAIKQLGDHAFSNCTSLQNIDLPLGLQVIGTSAFSNCDSLKKIELPASISEISSGVLGGCDSLEEISIPSTVQSILGSAFKGCISLHAIYLPTSIEELALPAFSNCSALKNVYYAGTMEQWEAIKKFPVIDSGETTPHFTVICSDGEIKYPLK